MSTLIDEIPKLKNTRIESPTICLNVTIIIKMFYQDKHLYSYFQTAALTLEQTVVRNFLAQYSRIGSKLSLMREYIIRKIHKH